MTAAPASAGIERLVDELIIHAKDVGLMPYHMGPRKALHTSRTALLDYVTRLLAIEAAARTLIDGTGGKSHTEEYGECYVPQDADFERLAGVVGNE